MALLSPPPKHQFFGDDGLPLSMGLVYTYEKDTTTPLATYTDSTGSVANANPIVLDNNGRASIWFQILPYSLVIHNSLGELQSCSGPVEFPPSTTSGSDIAAWSDIVVYNYPDLVAGTDGYTYRCVGTNILDDNPVGSVTGAWVNLSSVASPNLTGTPTSPTASAGTNTTQIATTAFVQTALSSVWSNIVGGDATLSANTLTFTACSTKDSTGKIVISTSTTKTCVLPATNNTTFHIFFVKLISDGSCEFRAYTAEADVENDAQVSAYRWRCFWRVGSNGVALPGKLTYNLLSFLSPYIVLGTASLSTVGQQQNSSSSTDYDFASTVPIHKIISYATGTVVNSSSGSAGATTILKGGLNYPIIYSEPKVTLTLSLGWDSTINASGCLAGFTLNI